MLKRVVIGLGVLIVISLAVIVWGVARNAGRMMSGDAAPALSYPAAAPRGGFGEVPVDVPSGSRLMGVTAAGERGLLRLRLRDGSEKVVVVDLGTGAVLGTLVVAPGPLIGE